MIASTDPPLRAIVLMAGGASPGREIVAEQNRYLHRQRWRICAAAARDSMIVRTRRARGLARAATAPW